MLTMAQGGFVGLGLTRGAGQGEWTLAHGLLIVHPGMPPLTNVGIFACLVVGDVVLRCSRALKLPFCARHGGQVVVTPTCLCNQ